MKSMFVKIIIAAFLVFICLKAYIHYIQATAIFFPLKDFTMTPADFSMPFRDVFLTTDDQQTIHGWFIPRDQASFTLLFFHGNGGNISHRLDKLALLRQNPVNIFIIDYRGYGKSSGKPSEAGMYRDARTAYGYLTGQLRLNSDSIILYGESIGSAAAIECAAAFPVAGVILEGAFSSGKDMARALYPFIPVFMFPGIFDLHSKIDSVAAPKLFIHSRSDEIVPYALAQRLYDAAGRPKAFLEYEGGHNDAFLNSQEKYQSGISTFIRQLEAASQ